MADLSLMQLQSEHHIEGLWSFNQSYTVGAAEQENRVNHFHTDTQSQLQNISIHTTHRLKHIFSEKDM